MPLVDVDQITPKERIALVCAGETIIDILDNNRE